MVNVVLAKKFEQPIVGVVIADYEQLNQFVSHAGADVLALHNKAAIAIYARIFKQAFQRQQRDRKLHCASGIVIAPVGDLKFVFDQLDLAITTANNFGKEYLHLVSIGIIHYRPDLWCIRAQHLLNRPGLTASDEAAEAKSDRHELFKRVHQS